MAQITPQSLNDDDACVSAAQLEILSAVAMQELDDEALGWFSRKLPWGTYGMLCRASLTAPDLGVALQRWCRHHRLLTEDVALTLEQKHGVATLHLRTESPLGEFTEFCLLTCLRYVLGYACWVVDSRIALQSVDFPFPPPPHAAAYTAMFACPVRFDQAGASLSFDARYLKLPLRRSETELRQMLQRALPLTVLPYRRDRLLIAQLRRWLNKHPGWGMDELAAALHMSSRTLQRRLQEEGITLSALKDEVRKTLALEMLKQGRHSIKQVALAVGFGHEKSFSRAFKQWTGHPPSTHSVDQP